MGRRGATTVLMIIVTVLGLLPLLHGATQYSNFAAAAADDDANVDVVNGNCNTKTYDPKVDQQLISCKGQFKRILMFWGAEPFVKLANLSCPALTPSSYSMAVCGDEVSVADCRSCLKNAASLMDQYCVDAYGAEFKAGNCHVRYETYPFSI